MDVVMVVVGGFTSTIVQRMIDVFLRWNMSVTIAIHIIIVFTIIHMVGRVVTVTGI